MTRLSSLSSLELPGLSCSALSDIWLLEESQNRRRFSVYYCAHALGFLCMSLARGFLLPFFLVAYIVNGFAYAGSALYAQQVETDAYLKAKSFGAGLALIHQASEIFPLSQTMRRAGAVEATRRFGVVPSEIILPQVQYALRFDPFSPDLLFQQFIHQGLIAGTLHLIPINPSQKDTQP